MSEARYDKALFIFRRDLRMEDNTGLIQAQRAARQVIPCFIVDPRQVENNPYRAENSVQFMLESLEDLEAQLERRGGRLYYFYGLPHEVVGALIAQESIGAVFTNRDYTPFSIHRDLALRHACEQGGCVFSQSGDYLLQEPEAVAKKDGGVYTIYTPFMKQARTLPVRPVEKNAGRNFYVGAIPLAVTGIRARILPAENPELFTPGGRAHGLKKLKGLEAFKDYDTARDIPALKGTTGLSAHNKFGTVSVREVYHAVAAALGPDHTLIRELYWRDFFTHIGFHAPHVLGGAFHDKYDALPWRHDAASFAAWCEGRTGFPIVDAGMRELNATGFMHNRVRMVTASFLVKDLHIDWRWGEKYFAQKLIDYDPLVNNGNWQWSASTGCDAQPYFRVFNPWRQQERFDPEAVYIQRWVPELRGLKVKDIHHPGRPAVKGYPSPIVDHAKESQKAKDMFKKI